MRCNTTEHRSSAAVRFGTTLALLLIGLMSGCALFRAPADNIEARAQVHRLENANPGLAGFKGIGKLAVTARGRTVRGRVVWAVDLPDRFRLQWLDMTGQPMITLACDGHWLILRDHQQGRSDRHRLSDTILSRLIDVPITVEDLLRLLAGRIPLRSAAAVQPIDPVQGDAYAIELKSRWHRVRGRIVLDAKNRQVEAMQVMDASEETAYRVFWESWLEIGAFMVPKQLRIESSDQGCVVLTAHRFWPNPELPRSLFTIRPPAFE